MSSETVKTPEYWGGIIQDPGSDYTSFDDIAKAIQDDATQSLRTQLAEKEAECACMREALSKAITLSKVVAENRDSDWHDQISNLKFYEPR